MRISSTRSQEAVSTIPTMFVMPGCAPLPKIVELPRWHAARMRSRSCGVCFPPVIQAALVQTLIPDSSNRTSSSTLGHNGLKQQASGRTATSPSTPLVALSPVGSGEADRSAASTPTLSAPCAYTPTNSMAGRPMMACSDRRPMFPVVHWMTRNGPSVLAVLILAPLPLRGWNHYAKRARRLSGRSAARAPVGSGVQPGELVLPVLLDTGGAPDFAARRGGNRSGRHQNDVPDIQAVRIGDRRGDVAFDPVEPVQRILAGLFSLLLQLNHGG